MGEDQNVTIEGKHAIYDDEVMALLHKLRAKGILLVVIQGEKNKSDIEYASCLTADMLPRLIETMRLMRNALWDDLIEIRKLEEKTKPQT